MTVATNRRNAMRRAEANANGEEHLMSSDSSECSHPFSLYQLPMFRLFKAYFQRAACHGSLSQAS